MDVYLVKPKNLAGCSFDDINDAIDEIKLQLQEGVDEIVISRKDMTIEEYENLPEFEGF